MISLRRSGRCKAAITAKRPSAQKKTPSPYVRKPVHSSDSDSLSGGILPAVERSSSLSTGYPVFLMNCDGLKQGLAPSEPEIIAGIPPIPLFSPQLLISNHVNNLALELVRSVLKRCSIDNHISATLDPDRRTKARGKLDEQSCAVWQIHRVQVIPFCLQHTSDGLTLLE